MNTELEQLEKLLAMTKEGGETTENFMLLAEICQKDVNELMEKNAHYGASWRQRGGSNAFHMMARKWDRLENGVKPHHDDIFEFALADNREESVLDDIGDLRRYLLLMEGHLRSLMAVRSGVEKQAVADMSPIDQFKKLEDGDPVPADLIAALPEDFIRTHVRQSRTQQGETYTKHMFYHGGAAPTETSNLSIAQQEAVKRFVHEVNLMAEVPHDIYVLLPAGLKAKCTDLAPHEGGFIYVKSAHPRTGDHPEVQAVVDLTPSHRDVDDGVDYTKDEPADD